MRLLRCMPSVPWAAPYRPDRHAIEASFTVRSIAAALSPNCPTCLLSLSFATGRSRGRHVVQSRASHLTFPPRGVSRKCHLLFNSAIARTPSAQPATTGSLPSVGSGAPASFIIQQEIGSRRRTQAELQQLQASADADALLIYRLQRIATMASDWINRRQFYAAI